MKYAREAAVRARALLPKDRVAWSVLVMVAAHVDVEGIAFPGPGVRTLGELCDYHPSYIGRALHRLEAAALVEVDRGHGPADQTRYVLPWVAEYRDQGPLRIVHNRAPLGRALPRALEARAELSPSARPARALEARGSARPRGAPKRDVRTEESYESAPRTVPHPAPCCCEDCTAWIERLALVTRS